MKFEEKVLVRLRRLGKTQKDLAEVMNYSPTYICDVLHGRSNEAMRKEIIHVIKQWERQAEEAKAAQARRIWL